MSGSSRDRSKRNSSSLLSPTSNEGGGQASQGDPPLTQQTVKKKRRRGDVLTLSDNWRDEYYAQETMEHCHLEGRRARQYRGARFLRERQAQAANASAAAAAQRVTFVEEEEGDDDIWYTTTPAGQKIPSGGLAFARRHAIHYAYHYIYGAPPPGEWAGRGGVIARIAERLEIPEGSRPLIKVVLERSVAAAKAGVEYDPSNAAGQGRR